MYEALIITPDEAIAWLDAYEKAWEERDVDLALSLFTADVDYREVRFGPPLMSHASLEDYWQVQVREFQRDVQFEYQFWGVGGNQAIATWQADFTWLPINGFMKIDGIFKLVFAERADGKLKCRQFNEWFDFVELNSRRAAAAMEQTVPKVASAKAHWDGDPAARIQPFLPRSIPDE